MVTSQGKTAIFHGAFIQRGEDRKQAEEDTNHIVSSDNYIFKKKIKWGNRMQIESGYLHRVGAL